MKCKNLFLLVGSNPLPNYLVTLALAPEAVTLFYSRETKAVKDRLKSILRQKLPHTVVDEAFIADPTRASEVRKAVSNRRPSKDTHLNYTGGTKVMASHARLVLAGFPDAGDDCASYLAEQQDILRLDSGREIPLGGPNINLTLKEILELHAITASSRSTPSPAPTAADAETIARAVCDDPGRADALYQSQRMVGTRSWTATRAKADPIVPASILGSALSFNVIPDGGWSSKICEVWRDFLRGGWLEAWCGNLARAFFAGRGLHNAEVRVSVPCRRENGREFEIDMAAVCGCRLHVASCTIESADIRLCKSKLFEVALRSRQMGGDLARSALVCPLGGGDARGTFVEQLRADVSDIWNAPNTPAVFGLDDLRAWVGGTVDSLDNWLDS